MKKSRKVNKIKIKSKTKKIKKIGKNELKKSGNLTRKKRMKYALLALEFASNSCFDAIIGFLFIIFPIDL